MKSIRFYLITTILAAMTLLIFLSALHSYRTSTIEAKNMLDKQLVNMADVLSVMPIKFDSGRTLVTHGDATNTAFQIWHQQQLVSRSSSAPKQPMTKFEKGFHDSNFSQHRWRNYVSYNSVAQSWVIVAERTDVRSQLIDNFILKSVMPVILTLPIAALLIWLLVGAGLRPLRQLALQLKEKQENDLSPVMLNDPVKELQPLVNSTNNLLDKLESSLTRAKRFSADAAHELRTPISGLKINLYNLQVESPGDDRLTLLSDGVNRLEHIVEQILLLYRTTPDHYIAKFEMYDLYIVTQDTIVQQYQEFENKSQQIELIGDSIIFSCDKFIIETLLQNLLSNASKYTPEGGSIEVSISQQDDNVQLVVQDSGPGIPEEKYNRIFDRFYRLGGDQHASETDGCGLGLSIVQHIVELHSGDIKLSTSKFKTGLAVTITFPLSSSPVVSGTNTSKVQKQS